MKSRGLSKVWKPCMLALLVCLVVLGVLVFREIHLEITQNQALAELDSKAGQYDEQTIVLQGTSKVRAESLSQKLGAWLRITEDGRYATLTLPEGTTIRDVYAAEENRELLPELSADYRASISDLLTAEAEQTDGILLPQSPDYPAADPDIGLQDYLDYMNLKSVWSNTTGSGVLVAVIDTGIDTDHPEFAGRISEYSYNATEDKVVMDYDLSIIEDEQGHGTAVAGVIAAAMDGNGIAGVAPGVELLVIKAECDENGTFYRTSDLVFGLYYAVERGAKVVNMSFGTDGICDPFAEAARSAYDSDILCVAAAGNNATTSLNFPAAGDYVLGVGALAENSWELAAYSNYGDNVNIVAPGSAYTTAKGGGYGMKVGTSLACPAVAGALALYLSQNPYQTVDDVTEVLYASCADLGSPGGDWLYGYGAVDVSALVLEEKGTVTFDMQSDEVTDIEQVFVRSHILQNIPEPERLYAVFDGWYYDAQCTEPYDWYADSFTADLTLYAKWANEDDAVPYTYVTLEDGTVEIRSYTGHRRYITIPDEIDGKTVSSIGMGAFENEDRLREVNLPRNLRHIGETAFRGCTQLMQIRIPASVEAIGAHAFADNARLNAVIFDQGTNLAQIGDYAFAGCGNLSRFELPASVTQMNGTALLGTTSLEAISVLTGNPNFAASNGVLFNKTGSTLVAFPAGRTGDYQVPASVRVVGTCAFGYTQAQVDLNAVQSLERLAFAYSRMTRILLPDSLTDMGAETFINSGMLSQVELGSGLGSVEEGAFAGCAMLQSITIPNNITGIGAGAFKYCTGLESVTFAENSRLTEIGASAFVLSGLREIEIPGSVVNIGAKAFAENYALSGVTFASGSILQGIGEKAFEKTPALTQITLPENLRYLQNYAFRYSGLTAVEVPANVELLGTGVFAACYDLASIEVAADNAHFVSVKGVVYDTAMETLLAYPAGSAAATLEVPGTVKTVADAAVYGSHNLTAVTIPDSVETVGEYGFYDCCNVLTYTLGNGMEEIRSYAFAENTNLTCLNIPDSVTLISRYAFANNWQMHTVNISDNTALPRLGYGAFAYTGLTFFRVPANIATMGQGVFEGCEDLESVTFAENSRLDIISANTFDGCDNLRSIVFEPGSSLTTIAAHGFEGMRNLVTVDFGDAQITEIGNYAFRFCESLTTLEIPDTLVNIGRFAFYGCKNMDSLMLPEGLEHIGSYAFHGAENLKLYFTADFLPLYLDENWDDSLFAYHVGVSEVLTQGDWEYAVLNSGKVSIIRYNGTETSISLNQLDLGAEITGIGGHAFADTTVSLVILPDSLTNIQAYAFADSEVMSITIPAEVNFIGRSAFENTPLTVLTFAQESKIRVIEQDAFAGTAYLTSVTLPKSLDQLGSRAFYESGIRSVEFETGIALKEIPTQCFAGSKLASVAIPDSVTLINDSAFRDCLHLTQMTLGAGEDLYLGSNAFYNTGLTAVDIPANVTYIGEYAFVGLEKLKSFTVSDENAWYQAVDGLLMSKDGRKLVAVPAGCTGSLTIPASVETIGFGAFENSKLSSVTLPQEGNILTLGCRAFFGAENLKTITIPASVVSIDYYAFANCTALESVTFAPGSRLTGVYEGAFYGCENLSGITLPDSVLEISDFAFYGCESITALPISQTSGLRSISNYAFAYTGIEELVIPETVTDIGEYAFMGINAVTITVPDTNKSELIIGIGAFADCHELEEITVPFIGGSYEGMDHSWFAYIFGAGSYNAGPSYLPESLKTVTLTEGITEIPCYAFYNLSTLEQIHVPNSVIAVGSSGFAGTVAKYELSNAVHIIDNEGGIDSGTLGRGISGTLVLAEGPEAMPLSFYECENLKELVLPDSMKSLGEESVQYCANLVRVRLPEGLTEIPDWFFYGSKSLQEIELPSGLQNIGYHAFYGCESLKTLSIPDSVVTIQGYAFNRCINLEEVTLGANVSTIEEYAFDSEKLCVIYNRSNLELIPGSSEHGDIAANAKIIYNADGSTTTLDPESDFAIVDTADGLRFHYEHGSYTLVDYLGTEDVVTLPLTVNGERYTIRNLASIRHVIIPEGFTEINDSAFCPLYYEGSVLETVVIPDTVTRIGASAFAYCRNLRSITIPDSVTEMGNSAFQSCEALASVTLSKNLQSISASTFYGCNSLQEINIPEGIEYIGLAAFHSCPSLSYVSISSSVNNIAGSAFSNCPKLASLDIAPGNDYFREENGILYKADMSQIVFATQTISGEIVLPDTLTYIPTGIFQNHTGITSVIIPEGVTEIQGNAFEGCTSLKTVTLPNSLQSIYYQAFLGCTALEEIVIPESVTFIESGVFADCTALTSIALPQTMSYLGQEVFRNCTSLISADLPDNLDHMGAHMFSGCAALEVVDWPVSVTSIPFCTFTGCDSLRYFEIPDWVTEIADHAFSESGLEQIHIPGSVTRIGAYAFYGCRGLTEVTIPDSVVALGDAAFADCSTLRSVETGSGITDIPGYAFNNCRSLVEVTLGENVQTIGSGAFSDDSNIRVVHNRSGLDIQPGSDGNDGIARNAKVVTGPDGTAVYAEGYENYAITETAEGLLFAPEDDGYVLLGYAGDQEHVTLPASYQGHSYKIASLSGFVHVVIPEGVTEVMAYAGYMNYGLRSVEIGKNVRVEYFTFALCGNLERVVVGPGAYLSGNSFWESFRLTDVTLDPDIAGLGYNVFEGCPVLKREDLWKDGSLYIGKHLITVPSEIAFLNWDYSGKNDGSAFAEPHSLKQSTVGGEMVGILANASNLETVIMLENDMESLLSYFNTYPDTLKNVVIPEGVQIHTSKLLSSLENVTVFVEAEEKNVAYWEDEYPGWNNGNKVYYGDQWNTVCFYDTNGDLLSREFILNHQIVRVPHYEGSSDQQHVYKLVGWDINGDGKVDRIPATTQEDIHAYPVVETTDRTYTVIFYDKDGRTLLYTQEVAYGGRIQHPADPTKTGYTFTGWAGFDENMTVTGDVDIYSSWSHLGDSHVYDGGVRVAATCTEAGGTRYTCTVCGESYLDIDTQPVGHSYEITTVVGCEEAGYDLHTCACGDSYRDNYTEAQGHLFDDWTENEAPTCSASGSRSHSCSRCGIQETEEIPALPHECDVVMTVTPSCTAEGQMTHICRVCEHTTVEILPVTAHRYEKQQQALELVELLAQNLEDMLWTREGDMGVWYACADCGRIQTSEEAGSIQSGTAGADCTHTDGVWEMAVEANSEHPGILWRVCQLCGRAVEARTIGTACADHHYSATVTAPGCLTQGFTTYTCSACGDSYVDNYTDALGHDMDTWAVIDPPTCTEPGTRRRPCTRCDHFETEEIPAPGHEYGEWYVEREATWKGSGQERRDCVRCDHYETRELKLVNPFTDVSESRYYYNPIMWAYYNGITSGKTATTFEPESTCTRAQVMTFLWAAAGRPEPTRTENPFTDVSPTAYYYKAVLWAVEKGITSGTTATTFSPNAFCTRNQVVTFLWVYCGRPEPTIDNPFADVEAGKYYYKPVLWAYENGITSGRTPTNFEPHSPCTRGQIMTFLFQALAEK